MIIPRVKIFSRQQVKFLKGHRIDCLCNALNNLGCPWSHHNHKGNQTQERIFLIRFNGFNS